MKHQVIKLFWNHIVPWVVRSAYYLFTQMKLPQMPLFHYLSEFCILTQRCHCCKFESTNLPWNAKPLQPIETIMKLIAVLTDMGLCQKCQWALWAFTLIVTSCTSFTNITSLRILFLFEYINLQRNSFNI